MSKFNEKFITSYDENNDIRYIIEADVEYPKRLHNLHNDLPLWPERVKIKKCDKLVCNVYDKNNYVADIRTLKQALNYGLILKEVHKSIQFNQKAWLKSYIDMNAKLRTEVRNDFEKCFFKLMNNAAFWKNYGKYKKTQRY